MQRGPECAVRVGAAEAHPLRRARGARIFSDTCHTIRGRVQGWLTRAGHTHRHSRRPALRRGPRERRHRDVICSWGLVTNMRNPVFACAPHTRTLRSTLYTARRGPATRPGSARRVRAGGGAKKQDVLDCRVPRSRLSSRRVVPVHVSSLPRVPRFATRAREADRSPSCAP